LPVDGYGRADPNETGVAHVERKRCNEWPLT
jgi:hypothetical protein